MQEVKFINSRGESLKFSYNNNDILLRDITGLTKADIVQNSLQSYKQQGYSFYGSQYGTRIITLSFYDYGEIGDIYERRRKYEKIFNPSLGEGTLIYTNDYLSKAIKVVVTAHPEATESNGTVLTYSVELTAYNPFFFDISETLLTMNDFIGGLKFPVTFSCKFGKRGNALTVDNTGDVEAPVKAVFTGQAVTPILYNNTTGEFIKVNTELSEGEQLIITTDYGNKVVTIIDSEGNERIAYNEISIDSTFFSLALGKNRLSFAAASGSPEVKVTYKNWWCGV